MPDQNTQSRRSAPLYRTLTLVGLLGFIFGMMLVDAENDRLSRLLPASVSPSPATMQQTTLTPHSTKFATWRWALEDGVLFVEYAWKPPSQWDMRRPLPVTPATAQENTDSSAINRASSHPYLH